MNRRHFLKLLGALSVQYTHPGLLRASEFQSDVLIVGTGACAFVLARELGATGLRVTLLESGIKYYSSWHQELNRIVTGGTIAESDYLQSTRRQMGGTTWLWGGICAPVQDSDVLTKTRYGYGADWPIGIDEIRSHYAYARDILSARQVQGSFPDESSRFRGIHLEPAVFSRQTGHTRALPIAVRYPEVNRESNIRVVVDATVRKLRTDGDRVTVCEVETQTGRQHLFHASLVILAAGGVQNVRLLQLSANQQFPGGPGNHSGHLGRHFMEHPDVSAVVDVGRDFPADWGTVRDIFSFDFYNHSARKLYGAILLRMIKREVAGGGEQVLVDLMCEQEARPDNRLVLGEQRDAFGDPLPRLIHGISSRDKTTMQKAQEHLSKMVGPKLAASTVPHIRYNSHHPSGGTRMSERAEDGVTDSFGRVHGIRNLYVVGSSLFPSNGAFHPTMTAVALSKRLADHLLKL